MTSPLLQIYPISRNDVVSFIEYAIPPKLRHLPVMAAKQSRPLLVSKVKFHVLFHRDFIWDVGQTCYDPIMSIRQRESTAENEPAVRSISPIERLAPQVLTETDQPERF